MKLKKVLAATLLALSNIGTASALEIPNGGYIVFNVDANGSEEFNQADYAYQITDEEGNIVKNFGAAAAAAANLGVRRTDNPDSESEAPAEEGPSEEEPSEEEPSEEEPSEEGPSEESEVAIESQKTYTIKFYKVSEGVNGENTISKTFSVGQFNWKEFLNSTTGFSGFDSTFNNFDAEEYNSSEFLYYLPEIPYPNANPTGNMDFGIMRYGEEAGLRIEDWSILSSIESVGGDLNIRTASIIKNIDLTNLNSVGGNLFIKTDQGFQANIVLNNLVVGDTIDLFPRNRLGRGDIVMENVSADRIRISGVDGSDIFLNNNINTTSISYTSYSGSNIGEDLSVLQNVSLTGNGSVYITDSGVEALDGLPISSGPMTMRLSSNSLTDISALSGVTQLNYMYLNPAPGSINDLTVFNNIISVEKVLSYDGLEIPISAMAETYTKLPYNAYLCTTEETDPTVGQFFDGYTSSGYISQADACDCPDTDSNGLCNNPILM